MTCKSSFLTIFFWHLRLPISKHQINTSINQRLRVCLKNNKIINLLCRANTSNLSAGLNNSHYNKNFDTKHCLFFSTSVYRCSSDVVFLSRRWWRRSGPIKFSRAVGCFHFRHILQSPPSQVWTAGGSYCPIFQAGLSVSFLSGVGCRRILLPHTSGRSLSLFPLRLGLQANLTAPYFRQVCQLSLVHSSWGVVVHFTRCDILITTLCEMRVFTSPVAKSWSSFHPLRYPGHGTKKELPCVALSARTHTVF